MAILVYRKRKRNVAHNDMYVSNRCSRISINFDRHVSQRRVEWLNHVNLYISLSSYVLFLVLSKDALQEAFTEARKSDKLSSLRSRFSELFAVMEILNDDASGSAGGRTLRRARGGKAKKEDSSDVCSTRQYIFCN